MWRFKFLVFSHHRIRAIGYTSDLIRNEKRIMWSPSSDGWWHHTHRQYGVFECSTENRFAETMRRTSVSHDFDHISISTGPGEHKSRQMNEVMKKWRIGQKFKFRFVYLQPIVGPAEHFLQTFFIRHWWLDLRRGRYINFSWWIHCHYLSSRACIWISHFLGFGSLLIWIMSH